MFEKETLTKLADRFWSPDSQRTIKPHLLAATQPDKGGDEGGGGGRKIMVRRKTLTWPRSQPPHFLTHRYGNGVFRPVWEKDW